MKSIGLLLPALVVFSVSLISSGSFESPVSKIRTEAALINAPVDCVVTYRCSRDNAEVRVSTGLVQYTEQERSDLKQFIYMHETETELLENLASVVAVR